MGIDDIDFIPKSITIPNLQHVDVGLVRTDFRPDEDGWCSIVDAKDHRKILHVGDSDEEEPIEDIDSKFGEDWFVCGFYSNDFQYRDPINEPDEIVLDTVAALRQLAFQQNRNASILSAHINNGIVISTANGQKHKTVMHPDETLLTDVDVVLDSSAFDFTQTRDIRSVFTFPEERKKVNLRSIVDHRGYLLLRFNDDNKTDQVTIHHDENSSKEVRFAVEASAFVVPKFDITGNKGLIVRFSIPRELVDEESLDRFIGDAKTSGIDLTIHFSE